MEHLDTQYCCIYYENDLHSANLSSSRTYYVDVGSLVLCPVRRV
jgi:hypothetical protein